MGMQDFAPRNTRTMWLFDDAITGINITGVGFEGTIVAKNAAVTGGAGQFNGTILAKSFNAQLEGHCAPFESYLDVTN
jgi:choice-of-anchor A domain-containing protein